MVNWYYVSGSERIGPVSEDALKKLVANNELNEESYVWRKGFQNWERLRDVEELNQKVEISETPVVLDSIEEEFEDENSPEVQFNFDWEKVREDDELFFVRIGKDRKNFEGTEIYGPYSLVELREALKDRRINHHTLLFSPGFSAWARIENTPLNESHNPKINQGVSLNEIPLLFVFEHSPLPLFTLVKKSGVREGILLGAGPFAEFENKTVKASLYVGNEIKAKNVLINVQFYDKKDQSITCQFEDLEQDVKKIMLNHAI